METYKLVLQEHLNHYGYLYGGQLLAWVDEVSYVAASLDYRGCKFVTVAMDKVEFHQPVYVGDLVTFFTETKSIGRTSITVHICVWAERRFGGQCGHRSHPRLAPRNPRR